MNENNESMQDLDLDDDWASDIDLSDLTDEPENDDSASETSQTETDSGTEPEVAEADQPTETEENGEQSDSDGEPAQEEQKADQLFELKHLDERREVTLEEMRTLAQKGMDYDRIRQERDEMREGWDFLKELADGRPVQDLIDEARAASLSQKEGINQQTALERVKLEREKKAFEAQKSKADADRAEQSRAEDAAREQAAAHERWRQECFQAFNKEFPGTDPKSIPRDVWAAFQGGETLVSAYRGYMLRELTKQQEAKQQAEDAAKRSTGSRQTAGKADDDEEFDRLWYDDD